MKIVIPGGTGQVGTILARAFHNDGHEVVVLGRGLPKARLWRVEQWNLADVSGWSDKLDGADVVINLAGRSVNCRYTPHNRREIIQSRVESVRALGQAISSAQRPPRVWLQASTATIYAHTYDAPNDEVSGVIGGTEPGAPETWRFSIDVATAWEKAFDEIRAPATRKVKLRSAMTMSPDRGGIFEYPTGPGTERPGRNLGRRTPVCFVDSRGRLDPRGLLLDRARPHGWGCEPRIPEPRNQPRLHGGPAPSVGSEHRFAFRQVDARYRCPLSTNGN
jgi:NAD dependent epimerase/dehydratase family enzyme